MLVPVYIQEADALYKQARWEQDMATKGYDRTLDAETKAGGHSQSATILRKKLHNRLLTSVKGYYENTLQGSTKGIPSEILIPLMMCSPDQITSGILSWLVSYPYTHGKTAAAPRVMSITNQSVALGNLVVDTASFNRVLKSVETGTQFRKLMDRSKRSRSAKYELQALYKEWRAEYSTESRLKLGNICLSLATEAFPEYLEVTSVSHHKPGAKHSQTHNIVLKTQAWWDLFNSTADSVALSSPIHLPTLIQPKPWKENAFGEASDGGYYFLKRPMIRNVSKNVKPVFELSATSKRALNHAQNTAWVLNKRLLDVALKLRESGPSSVIPTLPERPSTEEVGKFSEFTRTIGAAEAVADVGDIYFPKSYDWRLRLYDIPNDLNPQGSDLSRGLLRFARGEKLTFNGRYWLAIHLGNLLGKDKALYPERVAAVHAASDLIERVVADPLKNREWMEMEDPWQFLAACMDWVAVNSSDKALSHVPVSLDGSCSGMQHFSLLTRDHKGAFATNCTSEPHIQDLYLSVASTVRIKVERDAARGEKNGVLWWEKLNDKKAARGVCKRAVMTVPYGVTDRGITQFMIADKHVIGFPKEDRWGAATYITGVIRAALDDTMSNARAAQAYINTVAYQLALKQKPLAWRTPAGSVVAQGYKNLIEKRVKTPTGTLTLHVEPENATYDSRRAKLATSPNVIHSLDGAHLQMVVCGLADEGINDMFLVHDSFGVHAEHVPVMRDILRSKLYDIYKGDTLGAWKQSVEELSGEKLPAVPQMGDWDVSDVLKAEYLFA
jgi:DNA-directed RNA polymerase, mitochondrial